MKKFLILLMASLIALCSVGCAKDAPKNTDATSGPSETPREELHLEKAERFYVNADYFKALSVSKSTAGSQSIGAMARTQYDISTGDYTIMLGDLHQGGANYVYSETIYDEDEKKYDVIYESEGKEVILTYYEDDDTYHILGNLPSGMALDSEMIAFDYYINFYEEVTNTVIGNSPDVKKEENKLYIDIEGKEHQLLISPDATTDSQEAYKMMQEGALGYIYLVDETDEDYDLFLAHEPTHYYFIEDENFIIKNASSDVITTISLN